MNPVRVELCCCDITKVEADACVSSIHCSKDMTKGQLTKHLLISAGRSVQEEIYERQPGKDLCFGQVEVVSPGKLNNCKELMFVCLRIYQPGNEMILTQSILECLELAAVNCYKSIAFPALGTGQGFPPDKVAACLIEAVTLHSYQYKETSLEIVYIALLEQNENLIKSFIKICTNGTTNLTTEMSQPETAQGGTEKFRPGLPFEGTRCFSDDVYSFDNYAHNFGNGAHSFGKGAHSFGDGAHSFCDDVYSFDNYAHNFGNGAHSFHNGAHNYRPSDYVPQDKSKPTTTRSQKPKPRTAKKNYSQQSQHKQSNNTFSTVAKVLTNGLSFTNGTYTFGVRPQISPSVVGLQLNVGIDVSFITKFAPWLGKLIDVFRK